MWLYLHIPNEILYEFPNSGLNYFRVAGFCFVQKRNINNYYIMYGNLIKYRAIISFISVVKNQVNYKKIKPLFGKSKRILFEK